MVALGHSVILMKREQKKRTLHQIAGWKEVNTSKQNNGPQLMDEARQKMNTAACEYVDKPQWKPKQRLRVSDHRRKIKGNRSKRITHCKNSTTQQSHSGNDLVHPTGDARPDLGEGSPQLLRVVLIDGITELLAAKRGRQCRFEGGRSNGRGDPSAFG